MRNSLIIAAMLILLSGCQEQQTYFERKADSTLSGYLTSEYAPSYIYYPVSTIIDTLYDYEPYEIDEWAMSAVICENEISKDKKLDIDTSPKKLLLNRCLDSLYALIGNTPLDSIRHKNGWVVTHTFKLKFHSESYPTIKMTKTLQMDDSVKHVLKDFEPFTATMLKRRDEIVNEIAKKNKNGGK